MAKRFAALLTASIATIAMVQHSSCAARGAVIRTVALTGQPAPDTAAGITYASFGLPVLNDLGVSAFTAGLAGIDVDGTNAGGIWSETSDGLALVARAGSPSPGAPGLSFGGVGGRLAVDNDGKHAFEGRLSGATQNTEQGVWAGGVGSLALVARQGNPAVGAPDGVYYSSLNPGQNLVSNNSGQLAFTADLEYSGLPWGSGLWAGSGGNLRAIALSGTRAPGTLNETVFSVFGGFEGITLNDAGQTAFLGALQLGSGGVIYRVNDVGIWSDSSGSLTLVARAGSQAPGTPDGVTFGPEFFPPAFNNAGQTAFAANLVGTGVKSTNDTGVWSTSPMGLQLVAQSGSPAPGTPAGVNFANFYGAFPSMDDSGQIAIYTSVTGVGVDSTNRYGIWLGDQDAGLHLVVRCGNPAPGTVAGVNFDALTEPVLNGTGQVAFLASLLGSGVDGTNGDGIWATDATGTLRLIARTGDMVEVGTNDFRMIDDLSMVLRHGSSDGRSSAFNDLGQLAFRASFTDGSEGILVSDLVAVPEPHSSTLLAVGAPLFLSWTSRRRRSLRAAPLVMART